jgi:putative oxygen-independent coproporphyrinogen III oxidase
LTSDAATTPAEPGFGVYIHWPFCASKCPYCDFNSHVRDRGVDEPAFLAAYLSELRETAAVAERQPVGSIFFGGGTPSLMQPRTVAALIEEIDKLWSIAPGAEITLEANPSSVEAGRFQGYRAAGVNRVSLGVQALRDQQLKALGRLHTVEEARAAIGVAERTFDRVSFDLIYARPGQTVEDWAIELREALDLAGRHLSLYQLTIEPDTPFAALHARGKLVVPDPETAHALYAMTQEMTAAKGLAAYEISNHAAPCEESRHNLLYWRYGTYAGIGPGAHGRLMIAGARHATETERHPERWRDRVTASGHGRTATTPLTTDEAFDEALLMGLRLSEGLALERLKRLSGRVPSPAAIEGLARLGMLEHTAGARIKAIGDGRFVLNAIVAELSASALPVN